MIPSDGLFRAREIEAYEAMGSLDGHGETIRLILAEASLPNGRRPARLLTARDAAIMRRS